MSSILKHISDRNSAGIQSAVEGARIPLLMATIPDFENVAGPQIALFIGICNVSAWIPVLFTLRARPENGLTTLWDVVTEPESW